MKKIVFFILLGFELVYAQTGIGTSTPHASAKLEVASTNQGFLPPRVALTALNLATPVLSPATGLLIFNTATTGSIPNQVTPGYYYWDGVNSRWVRLEDNADNFGNHTASDNIRLNGNFLSNDGGNEGIRVDNNGRVGIGTTTPTVPLEINGAVNANTLYLSNSTIGTPSLVLRNGDAASAFSDIPQIRMGWSGSEPGTSQFSQMIHTRHNSGSNNNAIDFYLSDGTRNNTITSGSTRAMTITSPGDVEVIGKLNIGNPTGNVSTKLVGRVTAGTFLTFENLRFSVTTTGQRGLSIATVSGTVNLYVEGRYNNASNAIYGNRTDSAIPYTTSPSSSLFGWGFLVSGDTIIYHLTDADNSRMYRVTLIIMPSYINNFIAIERLL